MTGALRLDDSLRVIPRGLGISGGAGGGTGAEG